ncbi:MAG: hypothetical protein IMW98_08475 [Firmicutes bacterium]|nr:hypothetical protein [Bacillota bacterium]MBE3590840.1 hypothetical protein [Bacillota bacterium]
MTAIDWAGVVALSITVAAVAAIAVIEALIRLHRLRDSRRPRWAIRITGPHGERYWLRTEGRREEYGSPEAAVRAGAAYQYHLGDIRQQYVLEVVNMATLTSHDKDDHPLDREAVGA